MRRIIKICQNQLIREELVQLWSKQTCKPYFSKMQTVRRIIELDSQIRTNTLRGLSEAYKTYYNDDRSVIDIGGWLLEEV